MKKQMQSNWHAKLSSQLDDEPSFMDPIKNGKRHKGTPNIIVSNIVLWVDDYSILIIVVPCALFDCYGWLLLHCNMYICNFFLFLVWQSGRKSLEVILTSWHENLTTYRMYAGF